VVLHLPGAVALLAAVAVLALGPFGMGMAPSLQYRVGSLAGPGGALAQSLPASAVNVGIAFGSFAGGAAIERSTASAVGSRAWQSQRSPWRSRGPPGT
jgi:DHA1 family inner membrane transport protein